jgi:hypothetical protein
MATQKSIISLFLKEIGHGCLIVDYCGSIVVEKDALIPDWTQLYLKKSPNFFLRMDKLIYKCCEIYHLLLYINLGRTSTISWGKHPSRIGVRIEPKHLTLLPKEGG